MPMGSEVGVGDFPGNRDLPFALSATGVATYEIGLTLKHIERTENRSGPFRTHLLSGKRRYSLVTFERSRARNEDIASQQHEGCLCLPEPYDDGGFSGGDMDRPALRRLLVDIEAGRIDCVVAVSDSWNTTRRRPGRTHRDPPRLPDNRNADGEPIVRVRRPVVEDG